MAESSSNARATRGEGLQQIRVGPRVGTLYVESLILHRFALGGKNNG